MQKLDEALRGLCFALICLTLVGCSTVSVCPGKTKKEIEAERKADAYQGLANNYRISNDEEQANYYDEKAQNEQRRATAESDWITAIILAIIGAACDEK